MKWVYRLLLVLLICVLCVLAWPRTAPNSGVRTDYQLSELERARQKQLLLPIMANREMVEGEWRAVDIEGDSMDQHSELFGLANSKMSFDDSELYVFEGEEHEGRGGLSARVVDGCIVETRLSIYEW